MTWKESLKVGFFQILGIFPGISRSGSTLVGGLVANLNRDTAFKYSFMLYVPMSIAATGLELFDLVGKSMDMWTIIYYLLATIIACVATMFTTKLFRRIVNQGKLIYFSGYCLIVGILVLIFM
jgi:undecaprenyl-diphosphatase